VTTGVLLVLCAPMLSNVKQEQKHTVLWWSKWYKTYKTTKRASAQLHWNFYNLMSLHYLWINIYFYPYVKIRCLAGSFLGSLPLWNFHSGWWGE
jgi:hypothetical protein